MKEVKAIIKPFMLVKVEEALLGIQEFHGMTVTDCRGMGHEWVEKHPNERERGIEFVPKIKIEIVVPDHLADVIADVILHAAHTGNHGDGLVYITDVQTVIRIKTFCSDEQAP